MSGASASFCYQKQRHGRKAANEGEGRLESAMTAEPSVTRRGQAFQWGLFDVSKGRMPHSVSSPFLRIEEEILNEKQRFKSSLGQGVGFVFVSINA